MSQADAHYGGNLVSGARLMELFGDLATELLIQRDGDEGLFRAYESVDFLAPVYAGDYLEAEATITKAGNTSRTMEFTVRKVIEAEPSLGPTAARVLKEPVVVAKAKGTCITPKELQRKKGA
jgi:3-aminobutyryl-CoA ammonia-lyase